MIKIPSYLKKGCTIGITCPAGYMAADKAQNCINILQKWGYNVMVGKTLGSNSVNYFSAADGDRRDELQAMLDDATIDAILFGRGGYGVGRLIDKLDFTKFKKNPKWIIGYSDITILHNHLHSKLKIASLHAPMAAAFNEGENEFILSIKNALLGKKAKYKTEANPFNKKGKSVGQLVGGNLTLLANCIGTPSDINTKNKILFIEDIGEQIYAIDRMFYQLKRSGKFEQLAGLIIGGFTDVKDTDRPFGKIIYEAIADIVAEYNYPICYNFPVSHTTQNVALKIGVEYKLNVANKMVTLSEL